jgi:hypothetical protein
MPYLHNCGWSGDEKGHIREGVQQYLSYAYGLTWIWGQWSTRWVPIELNRSLLSDSIGEDCVEMRALDQLSIK